MRRLFVVALITLMCMASLAVCDDPDEILLSDFEWGPLQCDYWISPICDPDGYFPWSWVCPNDISGSLVSFFISDDSPHIGDDFWVSANHYVVEQYVSICWGDGHFSASYDGIGYNHHTYEKDGLFTIEYREHSGCAPDQDIVVTWEQVVFP